MINSTGIVSGEAPETDSEDEIATACKTIGNAVQGEVIVGEDSESEEEGASSISSAVSALAQSLPESPEKHKEKANSSLLHRKLRESNLKLYTDLNNFCHNIVDQAERQLSTVDRQLLKSQITMQSAVTSLKNLNLHSGALNEKLQAIVSSNFISNIRTK